MSAGDGSGTESDDDIGLAATVHPQQPVVPAVSAPPDAPPDVTQTVASRIARPPPDKLARAVARARIADKLFAAKEQVKLGRYHLLEMVGSGGMGVVWGAWDPELDRRVAIKLVKAEMQAARDRILLEGQALAKLSHPNVVPVYDVGIFEEQVYIVMEWVRGKNLRAYCKEPRTVREIVTAYLAAGEGLAAAHHVGLIHRDFKPDNAMIGDDGRVRVLDFGLAREEVVRADEDPDSDLPKFSSPSSDLTRGAGTPRYMPSEQAEGKELTPAVDQYAFAVSLREALVGRNADSKDADVPRWLDDILDRARSQESSKRYPSMDELIRALRHDPATVWRRRLVVAGALGFAGVAFAVGTVRGGGDEVERCVGGRDEIAKTWNARIRSTLVGHLRSLGAYGASEAPRIEQTLAEYGDSWAAAHREACMAKERAELTPQLYERNLGCLARARVAMDTALAVLSTVSIERLPDAVIATRSLPGAQQCLTETQTSMIAPPPPELATAVDGVGKEVERVRVLALAQAKDAVSIARSVVADAERLSYTPLIARANLQLGTALVLQNMRSQAIPALERATMTGLEASDDRTAVEAYARQIFVIAISEPKDLPENSRQRLDAIGMMEAIAKRLGRAGALTRALLYNNVGTVRVTAGNRSDARKWFERALAERQSSSASDIELTVIWANLALATDDPEERQRFLDRENAELEKEIGPNHPRVIEARVRAAIFLANGERSARQLRDQCNRRQEMHPHLTEKIAECSFELGWLAEERNDTAEARTAFRSASHDGSLENMIGGGYLKMLDGRFTDSANAMILLGDQLREREHFWPRFRAVDALLVAALSQDRLGNRQEAVAILMRALGTLESLTFLVSSTAYQRRLARVRATLARLLRDTDRIRARQHAKDAADWYRSAGGYDDVLTEMEGIAVMGSP